MPENISHFFALIGNTGFDVCMPKFFVFFIVCMLCGLKATTMEALERATRTATT